MAKDVANSNTGAGPVLEIASGRLRGASAGGIHAFKGIPYGAPTGGANRFLPPRPAEPWTGVRDALAYAGHAPQWQAAPTRRAGMATFLGPADDTPVGEDCLTLNVWTPELGAGKRPVMVWLHGGAFHFGSATAPSPPAPIWRGAVMSWWSASTIASTFLATSISVISAVNLTRIPAMSACLT
jgi:para-nitrobenzyl esterase